LPAISSQRFGVAARFGLFMKHAPLRTLTGFWHLTGGLEILELFRASPAASALEVVGELPHQRGYVGFRDRCIVHAAALPPPLHAPGEPRVPLAPLIGPEALAEMLSWPDCDFRAGALRPVADNIDASFDVTLLQTLQLLDARADAQAHPDSPSAAGDGLDEIDVEEVEDLLEPSQGSATAAPSAPVDRVTLDGPISSDSAGGGTMPVQSSPLSEVPLNLLELDADWGSASVLPTAEFDATTEAPALSLLALAASSAPAPSDSAVNAALTPALGSKLGPALAAAAERSRAPMPARPPYVPRVTRQMAAVDHAALRAAAYPSSMPPSSATVRVLENFLESEGGEVTWALLQQNERVAACAVYRARDQELLRKHVRPIGAPTGGAASTPPEHLAVLDALVLEIFRDQKSALRAVRPAAGTAKSALPGAYEVAVVGGQVAAIARQLEDVIFCVVAAPNVSYMLLKIAMGAAVDGRVLSTR
jgi:hypothetical protein